MSFDVNQFTTSFAGYMSMNGRSESTCKAYSYDIMRFISHLQGKSIVDVTEEDLESYFGALDTNGVSTITRSRIRSSLRSFYQYLVRKHHIDNDPTLELQRIKTNSQQDEPKYLKEAELKKLIHEAQTTTPYYSKRDPLILQLFIYCGLRRNELVQLDISDIDFNKQSVRVVRKGGHIQLIEIPEKLMSSLKKYIKEAHRKNGPLFISKRGNRISPEAIWRMVKKYADYKHADLDPKITVHSLRHSYATLLLSKGADLKTIQKLMGHSDIKTTSRYLHLNNEEVRKVVNTLM